MKPFRTLCLLYRLFNKGGIDNRFPTISISLSVSYRLKFSNPHMPQPHRVLLSNMVVGTANTEPLG